MDYRLRITDCGLRIADHGLWITDCGLRLENDEKIMYFALISEKVVKVNPRAI